MEEEELAERKPFATFESHGEFITAQNVLLSLDLRAEPDDMTEERALRRLSAILEEYQEQSYLLDPFLENVVAPVVECLKAHAKVYILEPQTRSTSTSRINRVAVLLYNYIKCRGYKTIIRFFPHEIADLSIALDYLLLPDGPAQEPSQWPLRYVTLLWLSLICMIPFDLAQFDNADQIGHTAQAIESLAKGFLSSAGLEREGAAILLSRLYMRNDTSSKFDGFLQWTLTLLSNDVHLFTSIGALQVLCEVVDSGPPEQVQNKLSDLLVIGNAIENNSTLVGNTLVRKFKIKLMARIALRILPNMRPRVVQKVRALDDSIPSSLRLPVDADIDVPEEVESIVEQILQSLQDKDTIVRWSAAKGIARISERLPGEFSDQILDNITSLFDIHSGAVTSLNYMPLAAENTWHGACLACAEMARRGLVTPDKLPTLMEWLAKALYFDLRKGSHSIGSNVRDAAAYVLWALARAQSATSFKPYADKLARQLVTIALYDREIHIRRAASAAFQEHVGRMNLFPHGIDVLRKTDFYSVSIRRNAFLIAAPQVAEHEGYRQFLLDHILDVTLRHWDAAMRQLGARSLRLITRHDLRVLGPLVVSRVAEELSSIDMNDVHGALLALSEMAQAYRESEYDFESSICDIFRSLSHIPQNVILEPRNELVTGATCRVIAASLTTSEINAHPSSVPAWKKYIEHGLKHKSIIVQESAALAMSRLSSLVDCSHIIKLIAENSMTQQSLGRFLGILDYDGHPEYIDQCVECLLKCANRTTSPLKANTEARRDCYLAIPQLLLNVIPRLSERLLPNQVISLFNALLDGLNDYTIDDRGDVGSWVRIASTQGLTSVIESLISQALKIPNFNTYLPVNKYHDAVGGILRQGVERLDNVRQVAGECFCRLLLLPQLDIPGGETWAIPDAEKIKGLFLRSQDPLNWSDGNMLFPAAVQLLEVEMYREQLLTGLVASIGSKTGSTQKAVASAVVSFVKSLPTSASTSKYNLVSFIEDLLGHANANMTSNAVVVPVLQTFNILLEADALDDVGLSKDGAASLRLVFVLASKNLPRLKSVARILESMKIVINFMPLSGFKVDSSLQLIHLLGHQFPKIRAETAEFFYLALQTKDLGNGSTDEVEDIVLETQWASLDVDGAKEAAQRVVGLLSELL